MFLPVAMPPSARPLGGAAGFFARLCCFISFLLSSSASSSCPPAFHARAISPRQLPSIKFYMTRTSVTSAADCASQCAAAASDQPCRSAVFNHDSHTCALSSQPQLVNCQIAKHRFNSFHLKTDGADALSLLSCIEPCGRMETNDPNPKGSKQQEQSPPMGVDQLLNIDLAQGGIPRYHNTVEDSPLMPIIPVNAPAKRLQKTSPSASASGASWGMLDGKFPVPGDFLSLHEAPVLSKEQRELLPAENVAEGNAKEGGGFLSAIQRLHQIQRRLETMLREGQNKVLEEGAPSSGEVLMGNRRQVQFKPGGINMNTETEMDSEEGAKAPNSTVAMPTSNSTESNSKASNSSMSNVLLSSNYSVASSVSNSLGESGEQHFLVHTVKNGSEQRVESGGFIKLFRPGERIKVISTGPKTSEGNLVQLLEPDQPPVQIPAQLVTMAPELFEHVHTSASPPASTSPASTALPLGQFTHQPGVVHFDESARGQMVVVNGRLLSPKESAQLLDKENSTGGTNRDIHSPTDDMKKTYGEEDKVPENGDEEGFLKVITLHGVSGDERTSGKKGASSPGGNTLPSSLSLDNGHAQAEKGAAGSGDGGGGGTIVCFRFIQQKQLQHAAFATLIGLTLNECRCACADTWKVAGGSVANSSETSETNKRCKSIQYKQLVEGGKCELNGADHSGKFDLVLDRQSDYHYVSCDAKYLLKIAQKMCRRSTTAITEESLTISAISTTTAVWTESTERTTMEGVATKTTGGTMEATTADGEAAATPNTTDAATSPEATSTSTATTAATTSLASLFGPSMGVNAIDCFERIDGFEVRGTAAGLERGVSLVECECLCANSLASRQHSFQCTSASYYHADRDCVLNLDSRHSSPELFPTPESDVSLDGSGRVSYLGMLCTAEKAIDRLVNQSLANGCTPSREPSTEEHATNGTSTARQKETHNSSVALSTTSSALPAAHSDECFLEQPNHVLEGVALAVETNVTVGQCKCFCVDSESRYGSACQSAQFYYGSMTCLLNRENKLSDPEHFNFDTQGHSRHSYFDYRCGAERDAATNYARGRCNDGVVETSSVTTSSQATTAPLRILKKWRKGKRRRKSKKAKGKKATTPPATTETASTLTETTPTTVVTTNSLLGATTSVSLPNNTSDAEGVTTVSSESIQSSISPPAPPLPPAPAEAEADEEEPAEMRGWRTVPVLSGGDAPPQREQPPPAPLLPLAPAPLLPPVAPPALLPPLPVPLATPYASTPTTPTPPSTLTPTKAPSPMVSNSSRSSTTTTTTTATTTTTTNFDYPPVGPCRFSALYQTVFNGARILKRLLVESPAQCLAACHYEGCRSANLIQMEDKQKVCELFRDSIVEWRRNDVLSFDRLAVHFDSIQCQRQR